MKKFGIILGLVFEIIYLILWSTIGLIFSLFVSLFANDYTEDSSLFFNFCLDVIILFFIPFLSIINSLIGTIRLLKNKKITWLNKICFFLQFGIIIFWIIISHR